jgi:hypothetical protein
VFAEDDLLKQTTKESEPIEKIAKFEIDLRKAVVNREILNRKFIL